MSPLEAACALDGKFYGSRAGAADLAVLHAGTVYLGGFSLPFTLFYFSLNVIFALKSSGLFFNIFVVVFFKG